MPSVTRTALILCTLILLAHPTAAAPISDVYLIDAHSQVDVDMNLDLVIQLMDQAGVYRTVLSAIGDLDPLDVVALARRYPGRILPAVTTKGPGYAGGIVSQYYDRLARQMVNDQFQAMAEVLIYHAEKRDGSPEKIVHPPDDRAQRALRYALGKGWPFVVHIEFGAIPPTARSVFIKEFEDMLRAHPTHPFILTHMGQLSAAEVQRLIQTHPNVHFHTSATTPGLAERSGQPWVSIFNGDRRILAPAWKSLFTQNPTRFIFAIDSIDRSQWTRSHTGAIRVWRTALADLPPEVAAAVAHGNAERLYRVPPK